MGKNKKLTIKEFGEFNLINKITKMVKHPKLIKGIGDDCAVIDYTNDTYLLITTDMFVNNNHFKTAWFTPEQIGRKIMECNVSDIAACGGKPLYTVISFSLPKTIKVEFIKDVYKAMYAVAKKYDFLIIGGDTTSGTEINFSVTMLGEVKKQNLCLRSFAKQGDVIGVTGTLGKSMAGLQLFLNKREGEEGKQGYLEPKARLDISKKIAPFVNAMIDISDGLSSEIKHICDESKVGAVIEEDKIPINHKTRQTAKFLKQNPIEWALYGGEDFELLFTISEKDYNDKKHLFKDCTIIGKILDKKQGCYMIDKQGNKTILGGGYDHFKD